jgi:hypothetical protein
VSYLVSNKKRYIATIIILAMSFVLVMIWAIFGYMYVDNRDYEERQSYVIAEQYKALFETDRKAILAIEPLLDSTLTRVLKDVGEDINGQSTIDIPYLKTLTQQYGITGIWLIEEDKFVHLSSEGVKETNAAEWYKDRPEINWGGKLDWLLENEGSVWVDTFSKRNTPPHKYLKWAYMGLGELPQLDNKQVVLEIGLDIDDAFSVANLESTMENNTTVSQNIISSEIKRSSPEGNTQFNEYQRRDGERIITAINADDFNKQQTQIIIETSFPEVKAETRGAFIIALGSSIFTFLCLGLLLVALLRKKG